MSSGVIKEAAIHEFKDEATKENIFPTSVPMMDPNISYSKFEEKLASSYQKHFCEKCVKAFKYKYESFGWITQGIIKFIEFRDNMYTRFKRWSDECRGHMLLKYNSNLNGYMRAAKENTILGILPIIKKWHS